MYLLNQSRFCCIAARFAVGVFNGCPKPLNSTSCTGTFSNVQRVCPNCNQATRIAHREIEGRSARTYKNCGELVDKQK